MAMTVREALTIMKLINKVVTRRAIRESYRKIALQKRISLKRIKALNRAYDCLAQTPNHILFDDHTEHSKDHIIKDPADIKKIKSYGLYVSNNPADYRIWVTGNYYAYKAYLKRRGFKWCRERRAWWRQK